MTKSTNPGNPCDRFCFEFENSLYYHPHPFITVEELRELVGDTTTDPIVQELDDGSEVVIQPGERIKLGSPGQCKLGRSPSFKRGRQGEEEELRLLRASFPDLNTLQTQKGTWIIIPTFLLPVGLYNREKTDLYIWLPKGYPAVKLDNFFVDPGLLFKGEKPLSNYSDGMGPDGSQKGVFSFHLLDWDPNRGDKLRSFVRAVSTRLKEAH